MFTVCLSGEGRFLAELQMPLVPRIGERISYEGLWRVLDVTWELHDAETVAQIDLEKIMGPAKH